MAGARVGDPAVPDLDADGRPTRPLPVSQLLRISLYWLGLSSIFAGLAAILGGRLQFEHLVAPNTEGVALLEMTALGALVAAVVQPTVGALSDHTVSRWGRRKPYIVVGSLLDLVFLAGIASSNTVLMIAAFVFLLQVSSNLAQGPFQGYVPDLVPARQVGFASALVGLMQLLGNVAGFIIGFVGVATHEYTIATLGLGVVEVSTMLSVVFRVRDGRAALPREGRSWLGVARSAWGLDLLRERSFLWLVWSRWFVLMGGGVLINLNVFYLARSLGLDEAGTGTVGIILSGLIAAGALAAVVPSSRISDRIGRKPVIYVACGLGGLGLATCAAAPSVPVALVGATLFGISSGVFLAVDWALMTEIIPKAASGRFMGISNVATATSGVVATAIGGLIIDNVGQLAGLDMGPRAALVFGAGCFAMGAFLLRPVHEPGRDQARVPAPV